METARHRGVCERAHAVLYDLLAGEENEDVTLGSLLGYPHHDLLDLTQKLVGVVIHERRIVNDVHRIHLRIDPHDGCGVEILAEDLRVDGRRGDDDTELGPLFEDALEKPEDEVDVEAAFVRLVHHDDRVAAEHGVGLELLKQDAVGHDLDARVERCVVLEAHLVADRLAVGLAELLGDVLADRHRRDAPWLGHPDHAAPGVAGLVENHRKLGGFTRAGGALHDDDLVLVERVEDALALFVDG